MNMGNSNQPSRQEIIPPTHQSVKAGFIVYSPKSEERCIVILEEGELVARETTPPHSVVFTMRPGDLVGVASLLEREPFKYELSASKDSRITIVDEDCMESELKRLPLWLLALIRKMSSKTHQLKRATVETRVKNTLKSLTEYLCHKPEKVNFNLTELIREFRFLTKIPAATIQEDVKAIFRRHLIKLSQKDERIYCRVVDSELMRIFADYQQSIDSGKDFIPYKLSILQKRLLIFLAPLEMTEPKTSPEWISFIQEKFKDVEVSQWINLLKLEWFRKMDGDNDRYEMDKKTIRYFLKALRYETNIRGVL